MTDVRIFHGLEELDAAEGTDLGTSGWHTIEQEQIDSFAQATGDRQWIHVDPDRAAEGPFGTTIAHGLLTLSLLPVLLQELYRVDGISMAINYGLDKVRFVAPVPVGSRVLLAATIAEVDPLDSAVQVSLQSTFELEGWAKPAAVVTSIARFVG